MILSALYYCIAKKLFITSSFVLKAHIVLNISDEVLQTDSFIVKYQCPSTFSTFYPKINFSNSDIICDILYVNNLVVHLSYLDSQLYHWFVEI